MGGLFSSQPEKPKPTQTYTPQTRSYYTNASQSTTSYVNQARENERIAANLLALEQYRVIQQRLNAERVQRATQLLKCEKISKDPYILQSFVGDGVTSFALINTSHPEFLTIKRKIKNRQIVVDRIEKVYNPLLEQAYNLKKEQKFRQFGTYSEDLLFHGTKRKNISNICTYNFDWRLTGSSVGHKFGRGISFSPNAKYASNYSDKEFNKILIVAKVLIVRSCLGNQDMILPEEGCDTSRKDQGIVIVKYEDSEFYPNYIVHYHFKYDECSYRN